MCTYIRPKHTIQRYCRFCFEIIAIKGLYNWELLTLMMLTTNSTPTARQFHMESESMETYFNLSKISPPFPKSNICFCLNHFLCQITKFLILLTLFSCIISLVYTVCLKKMLIREIPQLCLISGIYMPFTWFF